MQDNNGEVAPNTNAKLELELTCCTHFNTKPGKPRSMRAIKSRAQYDGLRQVLFSCVNTLSISVLVKAQPLLWGFITQEQLRWMLREPEVCVLQPLSHKFLSEEHAAEMNLKAITEAKNNWAEETYYRACLHLLLSADDKKKLLVWLDGLLEEGAMT